MKQLVAIAFLALIGIAEFGATLVLVDFQLDRERIIRELCEQRDLIPVMQTCKGQCVLSKKLKAAEEGANHPMDLTLFDYSGELEATPAVLNVIPAPRLFSVFKCTELQGYVVNDDGVPWLG